MPHIILVDDTPEHLALLSEFIHELRPDARISRLHDGLDLPRTLDQDPAALVMMDLMMPSISGFDLVRQIRALGQWPHLPIIAVSGLRQANQAAQLAEAGFNDAIVKPYDLADLARVLEHYLPH